MMDLIRCAGLFIWLRLASVPVVGAHPPSSLLDARNDNTSMDQQFETFLSSIGLSGAAADTLRASAESNSSSSLDLACQAAQLLFGNNTVDTAPLNQTVVEENWSQANVAEPYCIVQPSCADEVSKTIQILSYYQIKFAVRSGGHSPNPGFSSVDGGVLLDLQKLNQIAFANADDTSVVSVGPGARWGDVIDYLDAYGTAVVGGRIPSVGVGGLILGGGLFHFSGKYGLAADNVKNFEIVLSDGTVTNASSEENTDLFWALKGGGPNFGIVTRFDLYTVPSRDIWLRFTVHSVDQVDDVFDAFVQWQNDGASDTNSTVITGIGLDSIVLGLVYEGPADQPEVFSPFYGLTALQTLADGVNTTLAYLAATMGSATANSATRHDYRAASSRIDAQLYKDVYAVWRPQALAVREATGANQTFVLQPIPKNLAQAGIDKGGNPMGIPLEDHQWWTTLIDWTDAADDDVVRAVSINTTAEWDKLGQERGLYLPHVYQDDSSRDQNPLASYGDENVEKLKQIALKYDKTEFFQKLQNDGFLLSKA